MFCQPPNLRGSHPRTSGEPFPPRKLELSTQSTVRKRKLSGLFVANASGMADPLSITVSVVAVVTAAIQSTKSLSATVKRYKDRDKMLARLQDELEDLTTVLSSLSEAADSDKSMSTLLKGPVERCS